jgi:hypothetical protein
MKETIKRSPNMKIVIEWAGYSALWPIDVYQEHLSALLDWFKELNYRFWYVDRVNRYAPPRHCNKEKFIEMTKQGFIDISNEINQKKINMDLLFAPGYLDPNTL